jgi:hypothetical protein
MAPETLTRKAELSVMERGSMERRNLTDAAGHSDGASPNGENPKRAEDPHHAAAIEHGHAAISKTSGAGHH